MLSSVLHHARGSFFILLPCVRRELLIVNDLLTDFYGLIYHLCMMPVMVKESDLDRIDVPEDYEVLDATEDRDAVQSRLL
jgi:hypothetical protein